VDPRAECGGVISPPWRSISAPLGRVGGERRFVSTATLEGTEGMGVGGVLVASRQRFGGVRGEDGGEMSLEVERSRFAPLGTRREEGASADERADAEYMSGTVVP